MLSPILDYGIFSAAATMSKGLPNPHESLGSHDEVLDDEHLCAPLPS